MKKNILFFGVSLFLLSIPASAMTCFQEDSITFKTLFDSNLILKPLVFKTTSDTALKIYYIKPQNIPKKSKLPAVIWVHGGGWTSGDAKTFFPHARYYSLRGAVGISIEYRLIKYRGRGLQACIADCRAAIQFIRQHAAELNIDPNKIVVMGDSAGGHLAACLGVMDERFDEWNDYHLQDAVPNALVLYNPCVDMTIYPLVKNTLAYKIENIKKLDSASISVTDWDSAKLFSPISYIKPHQPPCLLLHGLDDKVIPSEQSSRFYQQMIKAGNKAEIMLLPAIRHAFVVPKYTATEEVVVKAIISSDEFLQKLGWIKGKSPLKVSNPPQWNTKK